MYPTLKSIASEAKVSIKTVSRVVNNDPKVSKSTREIIQDIIKTRGYKPNLIARGLKKRKTNTIGFIVPDIGNPSFTEIAKGCTDIFNKNGYYVFLGSSENNPQKEIEIMQDLMSMLIEGIILIPSITAERDLSFFSKIKCPIVILDREIDGLDKDRVVLSNKKGAYSATRLLIENENKKIVILGGLKSAKTSQRRFEGFKKAMSERNLFSEDLAFWGDFSIDSGYLMMKEAFNRFKKDIGAVFAGNDLIALGAISAIKEYGLKIPEDISLIGFDDMFFSAYLNPPLTTVHIPFIKEGAVAAKLLLKKMANPEDNSINRIIIDTNIIIRESVKNKKI